VKAPGDSTDWDHTVLSIAGRSIDFVIVHWYPGGTTTADLLNTASRIAGVTSSLRSLIATYAGSHAASVQIAVTETDADFSPARTSQAAALFWADTCMTWFEHGAAAHGPLRDTCDVRVFGRCLNSSRTLRILSVRSATFPGCWTTGGRRIY
jgi:hypothetical protein